MSWVQELREREEQRHQDYLVEERGRQDRSRAIENSLPAWWNSFKVALVDYANELKTAFPSNRSRHFSFFDPENAPMTCGLTTEWPPERMLLVSVKHSFPHHQIIAEYKTRTLDTSGHPSHVLEYGRFQIGDSGLTVVFEQKFCPSPQSTAEHLIRNFGGVR
jgi:hypothetical protein